MITEKLLRIVLIGKNSLLKDGIDNSIRQIRCENGFPYFIEKDKCIESELISLKPDVIVIQEHEKELSLKSLDFIKKPTMKNKTLLVVCSYNEKTIVRYCEKGFKNLISPNNSGDDLIKAIHQVASGKNYISDIFSKILVFDLLNLMHDQAFANMNQLTDRESRILDLICKGLSNKEISDELEISKRTVETHRRNIKNKMEAKNTADMVKKASLYLG